MIENNYRTQVRMNDHQNIPFTEEEIYLMIEMFERVGIKNAESEKVREKLLRGYENLWNAKEVKTRRHPSILYAECGI
jgi:hypothetical protein